MEGLITGRIVHYNPWPNESYGDSKCRAAIITNVFGEDTVNLTVFMDWINDGRQYQDNSLLWTTSRHYSETLEAGTWHWPERV